MLSDTYDNSEDLANAFGEIDEFEARLNGEQPTRARDPNAAKPTNAAAAARLEKPKGPPPVRQANPANAPGKGKVGPSEEEEETKTARKQDIDDVANLPDYD
jgi:hypothetical protein